MRLLISLSALLLSTLFVQMGIGSLRPFDAISGQALGFTSVEIGFLASGHFAGFLLGCIFSPYLVRRAGHSRAFAVMAGAAVISIIGAKPNVFSAWVIILPITAGGIKDGVPPPKNMLFRARRSGNMLAI